jgi:hypothetical protein
MVFHLVSHEVYRFKIINPTYIRKTPIGILPHTIKFTQKNLQKPRFRKIRSNMSSASRAWIVAASIAAVETLKDQGVCRWNFVIRSMQQHAKNNIRSYYQASKLSAQSSAAISNHIKRSKEESVRKVMDLSCWGPNTIRF